MNPLFKLRSTWPAVMLVLFAFSVMFSAVSSAENYDPTAEINAVQAEIDAKGYNWIAGENEINRLAPEDRPPLIEIEPDPIASGKFDLDAHLSKITTRDLPSAWDWRVNEGVTPAKQQGGCGSCWDFAATGAFEAAIRIATGRIENLSEQHVLVCNYAGHGCSGGWAESAYEVFMYPGAVEESCFPYVANDNVPCSNGDNCEVIDFLDGYEDITPNTVANIKEAVFRGPVAVAVAARDDWYSYNNGCYEWDGGSSINHQVLIVGWDDNMCEGQGAWIIKNSWGTGWGMNGYMTIKYGSCQIGYEAQEIFYTPIGDTHINHQPFVDTEDTQNPYEINCKVITRNYPVDPATVYLHYDVGDGELSFQMTQIREGDEVSFQWEIPAQPIGTEIAYWISASDTDGTSDVEPSSAPNTKHQFHVYRLMFDDAFEEMSGWTIGDSDDTATAGIWDRGMPEGTYGLQDRPCNPDRDHTPGINFYCFCTGYEDLGIYWDNDVDGGKTTLFSPVVDLSGITEATLHYYRWYVNNGQSYPEEDYWQVDVSNDGGNSWTGLEYDNLTSSYWREVNINLGDLIAFTDQVQFRFIASDYINPSIVEAAIDDVVIYTMQAGISGSDDLPVHRLISLTPDAGIFNDRAEFSYNLPEATEGSLQVYSVDGRSVRTLVSGQLSAGPRKVVWDGTDTAGQRVPAGLYLIRLDTREETISRRILRVR